MSRSLLGREEGEGITAKGTEGAERRGGRNGLGKHVNVMWLQTVGGGNPTGLFSPSEKIPHKSQWSGRVLITLVCLWSMALEVLSS